MRKIPFIVLAFFGFNIATAQAMDLSQVMREITYFKAEQQQNVLGATASNTGGSMLTTEEKADFIASDKRMLVLRDLRDSQKPSPVIQRTIRYGEYRSEEVKKLQIFLIAKGFLKADPTGNFLSQTKTALYNFQKANGILDGDGTIVGPKTKALINVTTINETGGPDNNTQLN